MNKLILNKNQVFNLVCENRYKIDDENLFLSRCIDGRYFLNKNLPALAVPGADAGDLALILAAGHSFGFPVDKEKAYFVLADLIGGETHLQFHTDSHAEKDKILTGCGHFSQIAVDFQAYNLKKEDVKFIRQKFSRAKKLGANEIVLQGDHLEAAVLFIKGSFTVWPQWKMEIDNSLKEGQVFVYQQTLANKRYQALAKKLIEKKAVKLYKKVNEDYLYQALLETAENHLFETTKRLAKGLPIFQIEFEENGNFSIKEMGYI